MGALDDPRIARGLKAQFAWRAKRLGAGERPVGWKAGFGAPAAMEKFAISAPLVGFLTDAVMVEPGSPVPIAGWKQAVIEPEIAIHFGADLGPGAGEAAVRGAIAGLGLAFELADLNPPPVEPEAILAGNIFNRHVMLASSPLARPGGDVTGLTATITRNGEPFGATSDLESNTGKLTVVAREIADVLGAMGETLRTGEFIIAGSVIPPVFVEADAGAQTVDFEVTGMGSLTVTVER